MTDISQSGYARPRLSPGTRLNGIYEIDHPIGLGGMGEIYQGHVIETGDPVAIKMMLPELLENEAAFRLFLKEAAALHRIRHPAVVGYYFAAKEPSLQRPYLAMEFVNGRTLADTIDNSGALPFEAVQALLRRVASGLQAAHDQNIIHRDISPDNVIIPYNDVAQAKIIDFGIARTTQHGTVIGGGFAGKVSYVSPEQAGLFGGDVTARSDIYSLGLLVVEALNGKPLNMGGSQFEMIEKRRKLPELGAIDMRIRPLLEQMLQPDPAKRPESMAAVAAWTPGTGRRGRTGRKDRLPTGPRPARSGWRWQYAAGAAVALALICGGTGAYYFYGLPPAGLGSAPSPTPSLQSGTPRNPVPQGRVEQIRTYIDRYNGGNCFFLSPVAVSDSAAAIEGFGGSIEPFRAFDAAFRRDIGFEADIGVHEINQQQCPAAAFLAGLRGKSARAPRLDIDREEVHNGDIINGMIDRYGGNQIALILVSDSGVVQNVSSLLKPGTDAKMFKIGMKRIDGITGRQPQLLIALQSPSRLAALAPSDATTAEQFFARVTSEAAKSNTPLSAAARFFVLEN